jgi:hypothetical protein
MCLKRGILRSFYGDYKFIACGFVSCNKSFTSILGDFGVSRREFNEYLDIDFSCKGLITKVFNPTFEIHHSTSLPNELCSEIAKS